MVGRTGVGIEALPRDECLRLLAGEEVGRVGLVDGTHPIVLPVNYVLDGDEVVFSTEAGTKLDLARRGPVAFEVDHVDREHRRGWSVLVQGTAHEVTDYDRGDLLARVRALALDPWTPGDKPYLLRISPQVVTGRRITGAAAG